MLSCRNGLRNGSAQLIAYWVFGCSGLSDCECLLGCGGDWGATGMPAASTAREPSTSCLLPLLAVDKKPLNQLLGGIVRTLKANNNFKLYFGRQVCHVFLACFKL